MKSISALLVLFLLSFSAFGEELDESPAESSWYEDVDLDPFNMKGITPRYAYVDFDKIIGYTHYTGASYFKKSGAESEGITFRVGLGTLGEKYNLAYTNAFSFMHVDFGLSLYSLDDDNPKDLEREELIALELGLRMWVVQVIGVVTENTSFVSLAYGF